MQTGTFSSGELNLNAVLNGMAAEEVLIPELYPPIWHEFMCYHPECVPILAGPPGQQLPGLIGGCILEDMNACRL